MEITECRCEVSHLDPRCVVEVPPVVKLRIIAMRAGFSFELTAEMALELSGKLEAAAQKILELTHPTPGEEASHMVDA